MMDNITDIKKRHIEQKKVKFDHYKHKSQPWVSQGIIKSIKYKDKLYKLYKSTNHDNEHYNQRKENFKNFASILKNVIFSAKKTHFSNLFHKYKNDIKWYS